MGLSLRPVTIQDEEFLFRLYASTRQKEVSAWGWDAAQQHAFLRMQFVAQRRGYEADYAAAEHRLILADGEPIGRIFVHRTEREIRLVDIAVLPEFQSRGAGAAFIRNLIAESQASGRPLRLQVARGNRAIQLYQRLGFSKTGEDDVYFQMEWKPA
jgi:ribosomal protein S18 acetylase RimI-like enzyme